MKKCFLLLIMSFLFSQQNFAQKNHKQSIPIELSVFNNGTYLPGKGTLGIWSPRFHPGVSLGTRFYYKERKKTELYQTAKLGYFHHRFSQSGLQAYTELGYLYRFTNNFFGEAQLGIGYLLSIPDLQVFEIENGQYVEKSPKSRSQFMGSLALKLGYDFSGILHQPLDVFTGFQFWVQSPFVNGYVPILPNNSVHFGIIYYLPKKKNHEK